MAKILKITGSLIGLLLLAFIAFAYIMATPNPYPNSKADSEIPKYKEIALDHKHQYNGDRYLPVLASAAIDVDQDGISEIFLGGGEDQDDAIYRYSANGFKKIESMTFSKSKDDASYGASVVDLNHDGRDDLLIARESGGYIYMNTGSGFDKKKIDLHLNQNSKPISFALGDINNDGHIDIYVSAYLTRDAMEGQTIFNRDDYGATSVMLLNNGDNTFKDITQGSGLHYIHNTFLGIFVDMDKDNDLDLVVAHDTGQVKIWRNNGDQTFSDSQHPFSGIFGYPMGIGAGDYNNDGLIDFYFSNIGPTAPPILTKGDLRDDQTFYTDLMLMENKGHMKFVDSSKKTKLANYEFSWGITMADLNLDGLQDIIISENYVDLPYHLLFKLPGRVLLQRKDQTFASVESEANAVNKNYEIATVLADFNGDGYPDQIRVNLSGKSKALISTGGKNKYFKVKIAPIAQYIGAQVKAVFSDGSSSYDWLLSGEGLGSDQEHTIIFGLGKNKLVKSVELRLANGKRMMKSAAGKKTLNWSYDDLAL